MPLYSPGAIGSKNYLLNGAFRVSQRNGTIETSIADNAYWADRWRFIGEATATCKGRDTTLFGGELNGAIKFTGTTDKGGAFQVIEGIDCKHLRSTAVVFSASLAVSNVRLGNIKMGIAAFTGTEDAVSADPVSAWGADGTTPTLAAGWAFLNTPANLGVTTTAARYSVTGTVGASANNLAVIIWNDDKTYDANDTLYIGRAQLEKGSAPTDFEHLPYVLELQACMRYCWRVPFTATQQPAFVGFASGATAAHFVPQWPVRMRTTPTMTLSDVTHFAAITHNFGSLIASTNLVVAHTLPENSMLLTMTVAAGLTQGLGTVLYSNNASAAMLFTAEL